MTELSVRHRISQRTARNQHTALRYTTRAGPIYLGQKHATATLEVRAHYHHVAGQKLQQRGAFVEVPAPLLGRARLRRIICARIDTPSDPRADAARVWRWRCVRSRPRSGPHQRRRSGAGFLTRRAPVAGAHSAERRQPRGQQRERAAHVATCIETRTGVPIVVRSLLSRRLLHRCRGVCLALLVPLRPVCGGTGGPAHAQLLAGEHVRHLCLLEGTALAGLGLPARGLACPLVLVLVHRAGGPCWRADADGRGISRARGTPTARIRCSQARRPQPLPPPRPRAQPPTSDFGAEKRGAEEPGARGAPTLRCPACHARARSPDNRPGRAFPPVSSARPPRPPPALVFPAGLGRLRENPFGHSWVRKRLLVMGSVHGPKPFGHVPMAVPPAVPLSNSAPTPPSASTRVQQLCPARVTVSCERAAVLRRRPTLPAARGRGARGPMDSPLSSDASDDEDLDGGFEFQVRRRARGGGARWRTLACAHGSVVLTPGAVPPRQNVRRRMRSTGRARPSRRSRRKTSCGAWTRRCPPRARARVPDCCRRVPAR
jgi:hypothetical protein